MSKRNPIAATISTRTRVVAPRVGGDDAPCICGAGVQLLPLSPWDRVPGPDEASGAAVEGAYNAGIDIDTPVVDDAGTDDDEIADDGWR